MPNSSAMLAVQGALYALLSDPATDLGCLAYDFVPEDAPYPFLVLGEAVETPANELAAFGSRLASTLHIWSTYRGWAQAGVIHDRLITLLDRRQLVLAGRDLVAVRHEQSVNMRDPDPNVRHVAVRFSVESFQQS